MKATKQELTLAALVMIMLPIVGEAALRVTQVQFDPQLYTADQQRGWSLRAGARGLLADEGRQFIRINSHGFHDREHGYDKPANTIRIAVLGNSWTEGLQVSLEKTYTSMLERKLTESAFFGSERIEVLNFGVAGYSTAQELLTLQQEVRKYHPDLVIVAFYSARDVANNVRAFNNAANPDQSPYFVYRGDRLVLDDSFRSLPVVQKRQIMLQNIRGRVNEHVRILQAVNALVRNVRARIAVVKVEESTGRSGVASLEHAIYAAPVQPDLQEAWHVTEGLLLAIRDEAKAQGATFRIVTLANRPQVIPDRAKRVAFMNTLGLPDLSYADERIKALGAREAIPVTVLAPSFSAYAEVHHVFLNGFDAASLGAGHWHETGHRLAAEAIAADICGAADQKVASTQTPAY
jgi:hypothetical protein